MTRARNTTFTFVVPTSGNSLDYYAQKLADHLPQVEKLRVNLERTSARAWNVPLGSATSLRSACEDARLVTRLRRTGGVLHLPSHHFGRYGRFLSKPYVVTVHDLIRYRDMTREEPLIHRPNGRDRFYLRLDAAGIRRAAAVIAVSETTKRELMSHLSLPDGRITVVYEGVDHSLFRPVDQRPFAFPYVVYVGSEQPRKNLVTLLRAFARLKREKRFREHKLVKVGEPGGREGPFREQTVRAVADLALGDDVVFAGRLPEPELARYYSAAECFALPSLYEGFGLPPLEAMACGCPVVVSSAGALPEVAGDAALVVEPTDDEALARAIADIVADPTTRNDLRARGLARAREFSWERAAQETMRVYERMA